MSSRFRIRSIVVAACLMAFAAACLNDVDHTRSTELWADRAEEHFVALAASLEQDPDFGSAAFFSASGWLDLRMIGGPIATSPEDMAEWIGTVATGPGEHRGTFLLDELYVSLDGAIAEYRIVDHPEMNRNGAPVSVLTWAGLFTVDGPRVAGRLFDPTMIAVREGGPSLLTSGTELYERYLDVSESPTSDGVASLYADAAVVVDSLAGTEWAGHEEIARELGRSGGYERGPWPHLRVYEVDGWQEILAMFQTTGACPERVAHRWILRDGRIVEDLVFHHVPSQRRCDRRLAVGWWATFDPGFDDLSVSVLKTKIGRQIVEIVNAEPLQERLVRWAMERFESGLDVPAVQAVWFPPSPDCPGEGSFARREDERYDGGSSVTLCITDVALVSARSGRPVAPVGARVALHELAHVWMYDHLTDDVREAFASRIGLDSWRAGDLDWDERAVEHAAETITWGLSGDRYSIYDVAPRPSCEELRFRFALLTGRDPLTPCSDGGHS